MADRRVNVKLTADASGYMSTLAKVAAATEALNKKVDEQAQRLNNARRAEANATEQVRQAELRLQAARAPGVTGTRNTAKAARDLARARANLADKTYDVENATRKLAEAQRDLETFPERFAAQQAEEAQRREARAVADAEKRGAAEAKAQAASFERESRSQGAHYDRAGHDSAAKFSGAFEREFRQRKVFFAAVVAGALTAGAPLALAGAAILFGGIAGIAGAQAQEVRDAWTAMGREISEGSLEDARVIIPELIDMADDLGDAYERLRPQIRAAFEATAPLVEKFTAGVTGFAENAMPGFVRAIEGAGPVMDGFQTFMERVGTGITGMFDAMTEHAPAAGDAFAAWGDIFAELLPILGELLGQGAELAQMVLPPLADALGLVLKVLEGIGPVLPGVVVGILGLKVASSVTSGVAGLAQSLAMMSYSGGIAGKGAGLASAAVASLGRSTAIAALGLVAFNATAGTNEDRVATWTKTLMDGGSAAEALRKKVDEAKDSQFSFGEVMRSTFLLTDLWDDDAASNIISDFKEADAAARSFSAGTDDAERSMTGVTRAAVAARQELVDIPGVVDSAAGAIALVGDAAGMTEEQMDEAAQAVVDFRNELQQIATDFVDPLATYQALLDEKTTAEQEAAQKTAESTESASDSWRDYVGDVGVSVGELAVKLQEQLDAQANWRTNLGLIAQWAGADVAFYLAKMGTDGVQLVADMAVGVTAENQAMVDQIHRDIEFGTATWATDMQIGTAIMETNGRLGARSTAQAIADELGIGVDDVNRIAAQYGIVLAGGINPILNTLGKPSVQAPGPTQTNWRTNSVLPPDWNADGNIYESHQAEIARGGAMRIWAEPETGGEAYIPLSPAKRTRSVDIWKETGKRLGISDMQYFADGGFTDGASVPKPPSSAPYRPPISSVTDAMLEKAYNEVVAWVEANAAPVGGVAGPGVLTGAWGSIWQYVKARVPEARQNSTYRPGDPGYHGKGKAIDFGYGSGPGGNGSAGLALINRILHDGVGSSLAELIYDGIGDDRPDLWHGAPHTYNAATRAEHHNHVHAAVYDQGGPLYPGYTLAYNGTGQTEYVSREFPGGAGGIGGGGGGGGPINIQARVFIGDREITDIVRVESSQVVAGALTAVGTRRRNNP